MQLTNYQIYNYAESMLKAFSEEATQSLPIKLSFCIQKNINTLRTLAEEIDKSRISLLEKYGEKDEDDQSYNIKPENIEIVNKEFADLMNIEQEVSVKTLNIDSLSDSIELTNAQMNAMMFMIEEE